MGGGFGPHSGGCERDPSGCLPGLLLGSVLECEPMNYFSMRWMSEGKRKSRLFQCAGGEAMADAWARAWCEARRLTFLGVRRVVASR